MAKEDTQSKVIRKLAWNKEKILSIIASCDNTQQLVNVEQWLNNFYKNQSRIMKRLLLSDFIAAIESRYYRLLQEFNTKKAESRNQTVGEYTEGRQKFKVNIWR